MSSNSEANRIPGALPREMMEHTYPILFEVEQSHWWYIGRRRILADFVAQICSRVTDLRPRILDVGCGTGANLLMLKQYGDAEGVDVSTDALAFCRERGLDGVRQGAGEELPYEDGAFDLVTAFDVVEHMDDDLAGLREMYRVLRPGGHVLLFVPTFMFLWGLQDEVSNHRRRYRLPELRRVLEQAGFKIERSTYANITFFAPILLVRKLMRLTGIKTATENSINVSALNGLLGALFGAESTILRYTNLPFGVSGLCVAKKPAAKP
ncbi:MAG: methyltransferase domain-containing protein [Acidobacteria bacterium]|nr:methyltransferase domain-containing protein [Acidobacteriota bacterium]MCA1627891.1 methyltransferase domain-containing protein [Acidobacteriota bacterium]